MTVNEIKESITAQPGTYNRFNKKNFEKLIKSMVNDPEFTTAVAHVKGGELASISEIKVTEGFRTFIKKVLEKFGVDKNESARVLSPEFNIDNVEGLYEFFATAIYEYISTGNTFDLIPKEDFRGGIRMKTVEESVKETTAYSPQTRECLGTYETKKPKHRVLVAKSSCPKYLTSRRKVK